MDTNDGGPASTLADHERMKIKLSEDLQAERERHKTAMEALQSEWRFADEAARLIADGIDDAKVLHAEHIISVGGDFVAAGDERAWAREKAIKSLLDGGGGLMREYVGTKSYDRWHGQGITCSYGMGPRHGTVIFRIGLTRPVRERTENPPLKESEIESAIYYLRNLERIQAAKKAAKDAAMLAAREAGR